VRQIRTEGGIVVGNVYDKVGTRNPIARVLVRGFMAGFDALLAQSGAPDVHEVGCGEGHLAAHMRARGMSVRASDFSEIIINEARHRHGAAKIHFDVKSIYDLAPEVDGASLVVCCEVLEHLDDPQRALIKLSAIVRDWCILSVPREPIWSLMNLARGKYLSDWGNTPGHVQRWSSRSFLALVERHFEVVTVRRPVPWTMVLCRPRHT
jgi:2-polyprenyl-3-methyl-5-hydroxy-6-metoxy-1,4-benzoquinol methylase